MKKLLTMLGVLALTPMAAVAAGDWYNSYVILNALAGGPTYYDLNGSTGNPDLPSSLGTFSTTAGDTLVLAGAEGQGLANPGDWYGSDSFVLNYRVYQQGDTPPAYTLMGLTSGGWQYYADPWDYWKFNNTGANVSLVGPTTANGTYNLDLVMSKKQYWDGGSYTSYIPGGQSQGTFPTTSYQTTFTVVPEAGTSFGLLGLIGLGVMRRRRIRS